MSASILIAVTPKCLNDVGFPLNAEMLIPSLCCRVILSLCASLLDINEHCALLSNKTFACTQLPFTQTGVTAVFSRQMEPLVELVTVSGGMIAAVTEVGLSDVFSGVLVSNVLSEWYSVMWLQVLWCNSQQDMIQIIKTL